MTNLNSKLRKEIKYILNKHEYIFLRKVFDVIATKDINADENGCYLVSSLYFDDMNNSAYIDGKLGLHNRYKYRIRCYNNSKNSLKIEKKFKINEFGGKEAENLSFEAYENILKSNVQTPDQASSSIAKAFFIESVTKNLKPKVIVNYNREAFTYRLGRESIRITFDSNLNWALNTYDFYDENAILLKAYTDEQYIFEVKYFDFLPEIIFDLLCGLNKFPPGFSKYKLCRQQKENNLWRK